MEHAQREAALGASDLVVIELHGVDGAAAKFVVLRIRSEHRTQQDASVTSLGVSFHVIYILSVPLGRVLRGDLAYVLQNYYMRPRRDPRGRDGAGVPTWCNQWCVHGRSWAGVRPLEVIEIALFMP